MITLRTWMPAASLLLLLGAPAFAQQQERNDNPRHRPCPPAQTEPAATPPAQGSDSGTAPGGMGSTGWSGGTGGSHVGTAPADATPGSPNQQPQTVQGTDPTRSAQAGQPGAC